MYWPKPGLKRYPEKRWNRPDRIFFGFGACHILTGVYLNTSPLPGFFGERIIPQDGFTGSHIYATDGHVAFDYHGYSLLKNLQAHYWRGWSLRYPGWDANIQRVDFPLLDTVELNKRKHLGPDQYFGDPVERARNFIDRIDHNAGYARASQTAKPSVETRPERKTLPQSRT